MIVGRQALEEASRRLAAAAVESPAADAEWLLADLVGAPRSALPTVELSEDLAKRFEDAVARRASREPLQHITGRAAFRYLDLEVGPGVFVPRPETEVLAGAAVAELQRLLEAGQRRPLAVDLCTGSGAIALAMAKEAPGSQVVAVDLSADAVRYAEQNVRGADIEVRCGDITSAVDDLSGRAHVVTANPPYIPQDAYDTVAVEARDYDPPLALWSGSDGLALIRTVANVSARLLGDGGLVLCEHADVQGEAAPAVFAATGAFRAVRDCRDLAGRPRFVQARRIARSSGSAGTITA